MTSPLAFEFGSKGVDFVLFDIVAIESSLFLEVWFQTNS